MERNELYPIFVKVHQLHVLIVGGGNVGLEKLSFLTQGLFFAAESGQKMINKMRFYSIVYASCRVNLK
jgi:siroheme synthase (precorrin-2 oxidase/ferrochelatase)